MSIFLIHASCAWLSSESANRASVRLVNHSILLFEAYGFPPTGTVGFKHRHEYFLGLL